MAQVEFVVYGVDIVLHRLGAENQIVCDGRVVVPLGHHGRNFLLAWSETGWIRLIEKIISQTKMRIVINREGLPRF